MRRKFYDIHHASASPIALEAMERNRRPVRHRGAAFADRRLEQRLAARAQYARPRLNELKLFLERSLSRISGKARSPEPSATRSHVGTHCCATWRMVVWR